MSTLFRTVDPSSNRMIAEFPAVDDNQITEAVNSSLHAYSKWSTYSTQERVDVLHQVAKIYRERSQELAELITLEMGKPVAQAKGEIAVTADIFEYYATNSVEFLKPRKLSVDSGSAEVRAQSIGPLLGIMPWNYPHYQVARFAAPNLALGNTILLKHATSCPQSALAIENVLGEAGLLSGAYTNLFATHEQVSDLIANPGIQGISLTGSERAGAMVAEQAGRNLKKVVLELGGSDPFIVLDSHDLTRTAEAAVSGRLSNAGQACTSPKRLIVLDSVYEGFVKAVKDHLNDITVGDPLSPGVDLGPVSSASARDALVSQLDDAVANGATLHCGGDRPDGGFYFTPAILTDINPNCRLWYEEAFGPIVMIYKVADENEAVALANDSPFGLGAVVFGADSRQADRVADRLEAGMVFINANTDSQAHLPFGGIKRSGFGRELGPLGIEEFANRKLIRTA